MINRIDKPARTRHAKLLRNLVNGRITNDEYEDSIPTSEDPAVYEVFADGGWLLYSDMKEYKLIGKQALNKEQRKFAAKCILFLRSEIPYRWAPMTGRPFFENIANRITFGLAYSQSVKKRRDVNDAGDTDVWPFYCKEDLDTALQKPTYLHGVQC